MKRFILLNCCILIMVSCNQSSRNQAGQWPDAKLNQWFEAKAWLGGWQVSPDSFINRRTLAIHYTSHPDRWQKAFQFLRETNLDTIKPGRYPLDGEKVYATVSEYTTKDPKEARYEAHRRYADIQYVVRGQEQIGLSRLDTTKIVEAYNPATDILFAEMPDTMLLQASPKHFFIFFPADAHKPGLQDSIPAPVRKVVVKVGLE